VSFGLTRKDVSDLTTWVGNTNESFGVLQTNDGDIYIVRDGNATKFGDRAAYPIFEAGNVLRFIVTKTSETMLSCEFFMNDKSLKKEDKSCSSSQTYCLAVSMATGMQIKLCQTRPIPKKKAKKATTVSPVSSSF
jgi:hypothetical protein